MARGKKYLQQYSDGTVDASVANCIAAGYSRPAKITEETGIPYPEVKKSIKRIAQKAIESRKYSIQELNSKKELELMQLNGICDDLIDQWKSSDKTIGAIKFIKMWLELKSRIDRLYGFEVSSKNISNIQNNIQNNIILAEDLHEKTEEELNKLWDATLEE